MSIVLSYITILLKFEHFIIQSKLKLFWKTMGELITLNIFYCSINNWIGELIILIGY